MSFQIFLLQKIVNWRLIKYPSVGVLWYYKKEMGPTKPALCILVI